MNYDDIPYSPHHLYASTAGCISAIMSVVVKCLNESLSPFLLLTGFWCVYVPEWAWSETDWDGLCHGGPCSDSIELQAAVDDDLSPDHVCQPRSEVVTGCYH